MIGNSWPRYEAPANASSGKELWQIDAWHGESAAVDDALVWNAAGIQRLLVAQITILRPCRDIVARQHLLRLAFLVPSDEAAVLDGEAASECHGSLLDGCLIKRFQLRVIAVMKKDDAWYGHE